MMKTAIFLVARDSRVCGAETGCAALSVSGERSLEHEPGSNLAASR